MKRLHLPLVTAQYIRSYVAAEQGTYQDFRKPISKSIFGKRKLLSETVSPYDRNAKTKKRRTNQDILGAWGVFDD